MISPRLDTNLPNRVFAEANLEGNNSEHGIKMLKTVLVLLVKADFQFGHDLSIFELAQE